jgi:hypothetical protein
MLREWGIDVTAISGRFTMSPLLIQEVHDHLQIPVFTIDEVMTGMHNHLFVETKEAAPKQNERSNTVLLTV